MFYQSNSLSRRSFLRSSVSVAAGAATGGLGLGRLATPAAADDANTIRVLTVEDPFYFSLKEVLPGFSEKTGIKIDLQALSYDAMQARLVTSFLSKTSDADVVTVDQMWAGQYVDSNWIRTLDDLAKGDAELAIDNFFPQVLYSSNTWRGKLATVPVASYGQGVMYRKSVFKALGIDPPKPDWTWDDYVATVEKLHGKDVNGTKMFGTVVCGAQPAPIVHMFTQVAASNGARWFKQFPDGKWDFTPTIITPEWKASLALYQKLFSLSPPEAINYTWFDAGTRFSKGDVGMFFWWTPYFYLIRNNGYMTGEKSVVIDDYEIVPLPKVAGKLQTISIGGWSFGIPSSTEKVEAAWKFLKWASSAETQKKMGLVNKFGYQFSDFPRKSSYEDADLLKQYPYLPAQKAVFEKGNGKIARPPAPVYTTLEGILGLELNKVLTGQSKPDDALKTIDTLFTNTLKGNFMIPYQFPDFDDTPAATEALIAALKG
jgi:multiple sugar transport system substrate-binding protein